MVFRDPIGLYTEKRASANICLKT